MEFTRDKAITLLKKHIVNQNMLKHCYASEAVMSALAKELNQDEYTWIKISKRNFDFVEEKDILLKFIDSLGQEYNQEMRMKDALSLLSSNYVQINLTQFQTQSIDLDLH